MERFISCQKDFLDISTLLYLLLIIVIHNRTIKVSSMHNAVISLPQTYPTVPTSDLPNSVPDHICSSFGHHAFHTISRNVGFIYLYKAGLYLSVFSVPDSMAKMPNRLLTLDHICCYLNINVFILNQTPSATRNGTKFGRSLFCRKTWMAYVGQLPSSKR